MKNMENPIAQDDHSRMLSKKHDDEKLAITLLIVGGGLIAYQFWQKIKWQHYYLQLVVLFLQLVVNALAFRSTNFVFSQLTDHGEEERKRHDLALEKLQRARDQQNENRMKRVDFINKRLREANKAKVYISNVDDDMLECYRVFAR